MALQPRFASGTITFLASDVVGTKRVFATPFAPVAVVAFTSGIDALGSTSSTRHLRHSFGFALGPSGMRAVGGRLEDATAAEVSATGVVINQLVITVPAGGASVDGAIGVNAFANGVELIVNTQLPVDLLIELLVIGGDGIQADVRTVTLPNGGSLTVTGVPFAPDTVINVGAGGTVALPDGGTSLLNSFGVATRHPIHGITQFTTHLCGVNGSNPIDTGHYRYEDEFWSRCANTASVNSRYRVTAFTSDGCVITHLESAGFSQEIPLLFLKGVTGRVVSVTTQTDLTTSAIASASFEPGAVVVVGSVDSAQTQDIEAANSAFSVGFATRDDARQNAQGFMARDNVTPAEVYLASLAANEGVFMRMLSSGAIEAKMKVVAWKPTSVEFIMTDADSVGTGVTVLLLESPAEVFIQEEDSMPLNRRTMFIAVGTSGLSSDNSPSFDETARRPGLGAALIVRNLTGSAPSITGKIQHSPDPNSVSDASANWIDLMTFTAQTANGANTQVLSAATPYFPRLRAQVTRGGTSVTNLDYEVVIA